MLRAKKRELAVQPVLEKTFPTLNQRNESQKQLSQT